MNELTALNNERWQDEINKINKRISDAGDCLRDQQRKLSKLEEDYKKALLSDENEQAREIEENIEQLKRDLSISFDKVKALMDSQRDEYNKATIRNILYKIEEVQSKEKELAQIYYKLFETLKGFRCDYKQLEKKERQKELLEKEMNSLLKKNNVQLDLNEKYFIDMTDTKNKDWENLIKDKEKIGAATVKERVETKFALLNLMRDIGKDSGHLS